MAVDGRGADLAVCRRDLGRRHRALNEELSSLLQARLWLQLPLTVSAGVDRCQRRHGSSGRDVRGDCPISHFQQAGID